jgi:hypothetical protein
MSLISKFRETWRRHDEKLALRADRDRGGIELLDEGHPLVEGPRGYARRELDGTGQSEDAREREESQ